MTQAGREPYSEPTTESAEAAPETAGDAATRPPEGEPAAPPPAGSGGAPAADGDDSTASLRQQLAERTVDLQRLQAEYVNYKRRVDRDRELVRQNATFAVLTPILDVLDTIDRAREHGELEGGFKAVAEQLENVVSGLGLTRFGTPGDPFDPNLHEALSHIGTDPEVTVMTCKHVAKAGYKIGDRVVRAAQVLVVDPPETDGSEPGAPADQAGASEGSEG